MIGVVDTDVLLKVAQYQLLLEALCAINSDIGKIGALGASKYMIRKRLRSRPELLADLEEILAYLPIVEPSEAELTLAGEIEFRAAAGDLELDEGESILFAVAVNRLLDLIVTGDKRAIVALSSMLQDMPVLQPVAGKILCMEHVILRILNTVDFNHVRSLVCANRGIDKALDICFSCTLPVTSLTNCLDGLSSFIRNLREKAPFALTEFT